MQAQDLLAASLGIWVRGGAVTIREVSRAREQDRSIVRLWCLRGTLHIVPSADARWLLDLLRPRFSAANRARRGQLGLDDALTTRGMRILVDSLEREGPLTRPQIAQRLAAQQIPWQGQATIHIIWRAALDGLVCYGPQRGDEETFVLLDEWLPPSATLDRDDALAALARHFLQAYGPATALDLARWSGLSTADARRSLWLLGAEAREISTVLGPMRVVGEQAHAEPPVGVRLLPAFDGLWLGYRERDVLLPSAYRRQIYPGGGVIRPTVLLDGRPVGTWARRAIGDRTSVAFDWFDTAARREPEAFQAVLDDLGRFLGRPAVAR